MKKLVSAIAKKIPRLASVVRNVYYYWLPEIETNLVEQLELQIEKKNHDAFYFVQIGAHDGNYDDPIVQIRNRNPNWRGLLLEPQANVYRQLSSNLKYPEKFKLLNKALSEHDGEQVIYEISFSKKDWATGLASFRKESLVRSIQNGYVKQMAETHGDKLPSDINDYISEHKVLTVSFRTLISLCEKEPDCIVMDTEGFDFTIINRLLDNHLNPPIWWFEYSYMSIYELEKIIKRLKRLNYTIKRSQWDIFAYLS